VSQRLFVRLDEDPVHGPEANTPAGTLRAFPVAAPLLTYVSHIMVYRETIAPGEEVVERVVPDGAVRIVVNLGDAPSGGNGPGFVTEAIGPSSSPAMVRLRGRMHGVSVTLRAGAAAAVLGVPAGHLAESVVSLDDLGGRRPVRGLVERLAEQPDDDERIRLLQSWLIESVRRQRASIDRTAVGVLQRIVHTSGRASVGELSAGAGLGERRLQQLFQAHIGLAPRTWRRLARLHGCIRALRSRSAGWADVAAVHGFYDQSHLIREFRDLCGCTPAEFLRQAISGSSKTRD
jgi:AraC-like DNA-binding protein